jgi:PAS domain S-box-containing protein
VSIRNEHSGMRATALVTHALGLVAAALATLVRWALTPLLGTGSPYLVAQLATVVAGLYGGLLPGLVATLVGSVAAHVLFVPGQFRAPGGLAAFLIAIANGVVISVLCEGMRRARARARAARQERDHTRQQALENAQRAEQALQASEERWRTVVENAPQQIVCLDRDGHILFLNRTAGGYDPREVTNRSIFDFVPEPHHPEVQRVLQTVFEGGRAASADLPIRARDGRLHWYDARLGPLRQGAQVVEAIAVGKEITARREADHERERLLRETEAARAEAVEARRRSEFLARASAALSDAPDPETTLDAMARVAVPDFCDWCIVDLVSDDKEGVHARRAAVAHADTANAALAEELRKQSPLDHQARAGLAQVVRTGQVDWAADVTDATLDGLVTEAEPQLLLRALGMRSYVVTPLVARGRTLGAITFISAESGRRYTESDVATAVELSRRAAVAVDNAQLFHEAQEANRLKDEFLATLSHELRTPLNAIVGWTHLLRTGDLEPATRARAIETIDRNARIQTQLISDILDVSRIVSGKLRLDVASIDVATVVLAAIDSVIPTAEAKGVRLEPALDPQAGPVSGDPERLQQIAWNLLSNAIKFTPRGGRIQIRVLRARSAVTIEVQDPGVGISPEFLPYVFERFRQGDPSSSRGHGGLGLGLAIVKHLVELHGGSVSATSAGAGKGSTFSVRLPVLALQRRTDEERPHQPGPRRTDPRLQSLPCLSGLRVLVVDDDEAALDLLTAVLARQGASVCAVRSAAEGFEALQGFAPDVLLSDVEMPEEDGYTLLQRVRALPAERGGTIPAVALTAYARIEDRMRALVAGFQLHLSKPVDPAELVAVVASLAGRPRDRSAQPAAH